jgi:hypothetical protein
MEAGGSLNQCNSKERGLVMERFGAAALLLPGAVMPLHLAAQNYSRQSRAWASEVKAADV